jgi:tetratricopeptide (TPR) repeat protein
LKKIGLTVGETISFKSLNVLISLLLATVTSIIYWQVKSFDFISLDDVNYVIGNQSIKHGINLESVKWAFSSVGYAGNWHPITWISHALDIQFFGINPGMHHVTNVIFHILNAVLLFIILEKMTGTIWKSAAVAALFAIHPLHVESVAWISERKDVLSTFFWMLTMLSYSWYAEHRTAGRYVIVAICYVFGLMSKPMLVTLPFVLLLLDFWPLKRPELIGTEMRDDSRLDIRWSGMLPLLIEKIPLFLLAGAASYLTVLAQISSGAIRTFDLIPLNIRIENSFNSYISYLGKMLFPLHLAVFYPYPMIFSPLLLFVCLLLLILVTLLVIIFTRRFPYLLVGWLWYLGTLVPVIGIVQAGSQSMADRYTYIPLVGIFLMIVWGLGDVFAKWHYREYFQKILTTIVFIILIITSWLQVSFWKNDETLFRHALAITENNYVAHGILGDVFLNRGNIDRAILEYLEAIRINPNLFDVYIRLGNTYAKKNEDRKALDYYSKGLKIKPHDILTLNLLGDLSGKMDNMDEAIKRYNESLQINPHQPLVNNSLGSAYILKENTEKAIECYQNAIKENPNDSEGINHLYNARIIIMLQKLLNAEPQNITLYLKLGDIYSQMGGYDEAIAKYKKVISIQPKCIYAMNAIVQIYLIRKEYTKAIDELMNMQQIQPDNPKISYAITCIYAKQNMTDKSIYWLKQSIDKGFHNWDLIKKDPDLANIRNTDFINELIKNH